MSWPFQVNNLPQLSMVLLLLPISACTALMLLLLFADLQEAALWLAAAASADPSSWRAGGGCSEADLELLLRVRKLLTELDVADGQDEDVEQHTHAKFRRCFGALLTKQRRNRCLPSSAW